MLTHRERVGRAVAQQDVDRVPMRYNGRAEVDEPLARHLGIEMTDGWHERLMRRLDIDVRNLHPPGDESAPKDQPTPVWEAQSADDVERFWSPGLKAEYRDYDALADRVAACDKAGPPPWIGVSTGSIFTQSTKQFGNEGLLVGMADEDPRILKCFDLCEAFLLGMIEGAAKALGNRLDMVYIGDDLGTQKSMFISPAMIRTHLMPRYRRLGDRIHAAGAKFFFHCCGAIHDIIPDFIDAGVDIMNPIQPCVDDMEPEVLQRDFGGKICFCGGIDMQHLLPFGTPDEVAATVRRYATTLGDGGGYILDSANILHTDVPMENIIAMFRAGRESRFDT